MAAVDSIDEASPGEWRNIDQYVKELRESGFDADYENLWSGTGGFTAIIRVNGEDHAVWEGTIHGQMVKEVKQPLREVTE